MGPITPEKQNKPTSHKVWYVNLFVRVATASQKYKNQNTKKTKQKIKEQKNKHKQKEFLSFLWVFRESIHKKITMPYIPILNSPNLIYKIFPKDTNIPSKTKFNFLEKLNYKTFLKDVNTKK